VVPALLAVVYVVLVSAALAQGGGGFGSLADVRTLFENPWGLLAGWTHYLAFDLFIGGWEARDARRRGIPHLLVVPSLVLTFVLGPAGLLLYLATRRFVPGTAASVAQGPADQPPQGSGDPPKHDSFKPRAKAEAGHYEGSSKAGL
jgi:hypothetical protein